MRARGRGLPDPDPPVPARTSPAIRPAGLTLAARRRDTSASESFGDRRNVMADTLSRSRRPVEPLELARGLLAITPHFGRLAWRAAQECGLGSPERCRLLFVLGAKPLRAGLLAQHLKLSAAGVSELVEGLVQEGLVRRETDPEDRRAVVLARLTPAQQLRLHASFADLRAAFAATDAASTTSLHRTFTAASRSERSVRRITHKESAHAR